MRPFTGLTALSALVVPLAKADREFYASAVSYCSEARAIEIDRFLLEYKPDAGVAGSISFDISAASVEANLDPILNFEVIAYGIHAVNTSINLCDLLGGVLCPLPQYDFVGSATIPLPSSLGGKVNLPGVAYWIPDLEATAYVRLLRVEDNSEAACLRVDLSNGKTTRWSSVSWALGGLALGCVLLSLLWFLVGTLIYPSVSLASSAMSSSASTLSPALWASLARRKERLFLLISLLQFVATTGILSLQYPLIYEAFTANFAWALGVIRIDPIQTAIDDLRNGTGGNLTQLAGRSNLVGGTSALKSVYSRSVASLPGPEEVASAVFTELGRSISPSSSPSSLSSRAFSGVSYLPSTLARRASDSVNPSQAIAVPDVQSTDVINSVDYGIPHALVNLDISPYNAFTTVFINFLFLACIAIALILLGGAFWALLRFFQQRRENKQMSRLGVSKGAVDAQDEKGAMAVGGWAGLRRRGSGPFATLVRAGTLRLLIIAWYPLLIFSFYQWTLGISDSYAPIVLSVFTIVCILIAFVALSLHFFVIARRAFHHPPPSSEEAGPLSTTNYLSSPFRSTPLNPPITPNPTPDKALKKAERREAEDISTGELLAAGGAPYSPFWNAYKNRSRRTTAKRRNWWKGRGWWFGLFELLLMPFILACFVSFAKASGWTQSVALTVVEALIFLALCLWTPYEDKSSNAAHIFWQFWRVIISAALIAFNKSIGLNEIVRVAIGAVLLVIEAVLVILFFILLVVDFVQLCIFLVRGIKAREQHKHDITNPVAAAPMMTQTQQDHLPTEGSLQQPVATRSSLTLNNQPSQQSGLPPVGKAA